MIDLSIKDSYGICGTKVCIDNGKFKTGEPYYIHATIRAYDDDKRLVFKQYGDCLHKDFGYSDMERILSYANVPVIKPDQDILICMIDTKKQIAFAPVVAHTGERVNPDCYTPLRLETVMIPELEVQE